MSVGPVMKSQNQEIINDVEDRGRFEMVEMCTCVTIKKSKNKVWCITPV